VTRALALTLAALLCLFAAPHPASSQYFGHNKVQAHSFAFRVLPTQHFDIYYYPAERDAALLAARMAERWYGRLAKALQHTLVARPPIVLYASHAQFSETTVIPDLLPEGVGGFTDHDRGRVVLPFAGSLGETDHVLGHELVHAFQRDILRRAGRSTALLPLWFTEGMAEYLSVGRIDSNTRMWLRDAVHHDRLPTLELLHNPKWFPYRYGQALWAYLSTRFGHDLAARALVSTAKGGAIGRLTAVTGVDARTLSSEWHASLRGEVDGRAETARDEPSGTAVIGDSERAGRMNVSPALSPDGSRLVFLSERDGYSIDVFLADATTGVVMRKLVSTAVDAHFDSLQFLESAGAWDPDGRRFALATLQRGSAVLTMLDMPGGSVRRERAFAELDQIVSPTWSPDGRRIAFSAMSGGTSDLYAYDLERDTLRRLTRDAYADLQPAWSPDGRSIAFVTDRFTSSIDDLTFGEYRLALLDVDNNAIRPLPSLPRGKHIDPQWAGDSLLFVADPGGTSNVFRLDLPSGQLRQVTDVREGVSGITGLSPAISAAARAGRIAFTEYRAGRYQIRITPMPDAGPAVTESSERARAAEDEADVKNGQDGQDARLFPDAPAPEVAAFESKPYDHRLSLRALGQPYVSAGGGMLGGGYFRAGMSFVFSDLLEDQQLQTAVQVGSSMKDFASQTAYLNRQSRWNWGVVGGQLPITIGSSRFFVSDAAAPSTLTRETQLLRQIHRQLTGLASYPFSAAQRVELTGGVHAISYDRQIATQVYAGDTGRLMGQTENDGAGGAPVTLVESAAALVYDTSLFGATGPVLGTRYRFEASPTFGDLSLMTMTADYRRYLMPVRPFSLAFRVEHVGRYGTDATDPRLLPLVWTLRDLVRGYDPHDVLTTSRLTVTNAELRVPLVGTFGRVSGSNALPIDALAFADAGAFDTHPSGGAVHRMLLRSVGAGIRLSAGGFIFELDAVRPLDRTPHAWTFAVNFRPGF
jgi:Tol biopolymer transport system component